MKWGHHGLRCACRDTGCSVDTLKRLVALFLVLVDVNAFGGATCYQWRDVVGAADSGYQNSEDAALSAFVASCNSTKQAACANNSGLGTPTCTSGELDAGYTCVYTTVSFSYTTFPAGTFVYHMKKTNPTGTVLVDKDSSAVAFSTRTNPEGCPQCSDAGNKTVAWLTSSFPVNTQICGTDGCLYHTNDPANWMIARGGANYMTGVTSDGAACGSNSTNANQTSNSESDTMMSSDGATTATLDPTSKCGTFNGDLVCPQSLQAGKCVAYSSGGVACVATSSGAPETTPPAPNNGASSSTPATPDGTIQMGNTTVYYYNSTTVASSTAPPSTSGTGSNSGGVSYGSGSSSDSAGSSGSSSSGDSAGGGDDCNAPPTCDGDAIQCAILHQEWNNRCNVTVDESQAGAVMGQPDAVATETVDMSDVLHEDTLAHADGSCPADPTFTVNGHTFTLPFGMFLCQFFAWLAPVVMVVAYFMAARILIGSI